MVYTPVLLFQWLQVTDVDTGSSAELDFSLEAGLAQAYFSLGREGSVAQLRLTQPLDRELFDSYSFRIFARDRGSPPLIGETAISITVMVGQYTLALSPGFPDFSVVAAENAGKTCMGTIGYVYTSWYSEIRLWSLSKAATSLL